MPVPRLIDATVGLSPTVPMWPGAPGFQVTQQRIELEDGQTPTIRLFEMTAHCGTHIDAPRHYAPGGTTIDAVDINVLVGLCRVWEHKGTGHIGKDDLVRMGFVATERVLFKTRNSRTIGRGLFDRAFLSLLPDAIDHLIRSGVRLLGVDGYSIGPYGELTDRNHEAFCGAGGIIIEVLDLSQVEQGEYELIALPMKLEGFDGAPARVLLRPLDGADTTIGPPREAP